MDWRTFFVTFGAIFLAEMGDKSQFAAMAASAHAKSIWPVLFAVIIGLTLAGILGVVAGRFIGAVLSPEMIRWVSGTVFLGIGIWILMGR
jgi:putative Ca2+/H+ antiporter (TMEM165/GDT1 family)